MGTMIHRSEDVVSFLKAQHEQVKQMFERVLSVHNNEREEAFYELRRMLAVHETAEEELIHPAARKALTDGEAIIAARLREERQAKEALTELESMFVESAEFESKFRHLQRAVLAHAESEEREEFDQLALTLDRSRLELLKTAAEFAESIAPTRPHPGIEGPLANMLVGPFASMWDRSRDFFLGKGRAV